jgi:hypothetical protein
MTAARFAAAEVLAGAYAGHGPRNRRGPTPGQTMLVHAVELDAQGYPARALCPIPVEHLTIDAGDPSRAPTCPRCARALRKATLPIVSFASIVNLSPSAFARFLDAYLPLEGLAS